MLNCRKLVACSSDYLDGQLRIRQRIAVRLHLATCAHCRRFLRQMRVTQAVIRQMPEAPIAELDALAKRLAETRQG